MTNGITPWAAAASAFFSTDGPVLFTLTVRSCVFSGYLSQDSLYVKADWLGGSIVFRIAYAPGGGISVEKFKKSANGFDLVLEAVTGKYNITLSVLENGPTILHYQTTLTPKTDLLIPFWPRDIVVTGKEGHMQNTAGKIYAKQIGTRSGQLYFAITRPKAGTFLYLQNLTALADYCQQTETSAGDVVGGEWPELGLALPPTLKGKPLQANKPVVINDAFVAFDFEVADDEPALVGKYLEMLAALYLELPKPGTNYKHWPDILDKGLKDLIDSPGCWSQVDGHQYFNAYVSDYATPPEIMVQLAILLPLLDYVEWSDSELEVMRKIKEGLPSFYDEKIGTIMRWHPKVADQLKGDEEQKKPMTMDSWYLHHPLLNLSRLALKGDGAAKKLFLDSLEFSIKVAHHFNYQWPVFYKLDTLEVIKAETQPGKGGEKDVPGLYAHVMLQAWELTGQKRYLAEAEKSARQLSGLGFDLFYQANNTAFSAGAMLRLYKVTKKAVYKELSYLCIANILKNVRLWDCNYGYGKNIPSFFTLFPLNDAPYSAVYEEQEVFCAFHDYLRHAEGEDIFPAVRLLMAEYIRYLVDRAVFYYPTMLPKDMLQDKPKIGEVDPKLWIALEDLHDGWEKSGQVGQEVYGAGNAFGILPRHYMQVRGEEFMIYTDYPAYGFAAHKQKPVKFRLAGDNRLNCTIMVVKTGSKKLPELKVTSGKKNDAIKGRKVNGGHMAYHVSGNEQVTITWKS